MKQSETVRLLGIKFGFRAMQLVEMCGVDVLDDLIKLRSGRRTSAQLLKACLVGAESSEDRAAWSDYVSSLVQSEITIATALLEAADNDPLFVAERGRGPHLVDEVQSVEEETSYYSFFDGSYVRITPYEAEEITEGEYEMARELQAVGEDD